MRPRTRRMIVAFLPCVMLAAVTAHGVDCYEQIDPYYWEFDVPAMIHVRTADEAARVRASVIDYMWNGRGFPEGALPARVDHLPCAGDPPPVKGPYPSDLPKTLPGLVAWYDASSSVKQRNGRVWSWQDKSGLANHSAQAVVERQPLFAATGLNGKPAVYFDGVDDELDALDSPTLDPETMTLFLVLKAASTNNVSLPIPLAKLPLNAAYNFMIAADDTPAATVNVGAGLLTTQEMDPVAGQAEIWVGSYDGRELRLYRNQWPSELGPATVGSITATTGALRIGGGDTAANNAFQGWIAEVILYDRALSDVDRKLVEDYLGWRYGIDQAWPKWINGIGTANVDCVDRLDIALDYGMHSYAYVLRPAAPNNRLLIYHQGHDDFLLSGGGRETLRDFLDRGFTAATFWMPLHGETTKTAYDVPGHGTVTFYWHNPMTILEDERGSFIRFFLEPVFVGINYAEATLAPQDINMAGISGGGWTTHMIASLDTRVGLSFPVAGSLPIYLRKGPCPNGSDGDAEQVWKPLYEQRATWPDVYILGGYGPRRKQIHVLNQYDSCCFWGVNYLTYEPYVAEAVRGLDAGEYRVHLDTTHREHKISDPVLDHVLWPAVTAQTLPYRPETDLVVTQSDSPDPLMAGESITYTLRISNSGPSKARSVSLTDTLPATTTIVSATPSQGTCAGSGPVTCDIGTIAEGGAATISIVAATTAAGPATNEAAASYEFADFRPANNASSETTSVGTPGDLDGDGVADAADCAPLDGAAFALPQEVTGLRVEDDEQTFRWDSAAPGSGYGTVHDLLRGALAELPVGQGSAETCVVAGIPAAARVDASVPTEGEGYWYLARGRNACGVGTYGETSYGTERVSAACP